MRDTVIGTCEACNADYVNIAPVVTHGRLVLSCDRCSGLVDERAPAMTNIICPDCRIRYLPTHGECQCARDAA